MESIKSHKKTKVHLKQEQYTKSDQVIESQSSHRQVNLKKQGNSQAKQQSNFQREQMRNIRQKIFLKKVVKRFHALISLKVSPKDITQEWQINNQPTSGQKLQDNQRFGQNIDFLYPWMKAVSILQGISLILIIWMISITVVFQQKFFTREFFICLILELAFLLFKLFLINFSSELAKIQWQTKLKILLPYSLAIAASLLMIIRNNISHSPLSILLDVCASLILIGIGKTISRYFQIVRIYAQNKKIIKQLRIIEMFCILFVIAHIFGLIIYSSTYITPQGQQNWLSLLRLEQKQWRTKYIYSVYWAITTIVTVGYGDLTPQNQVEVIIISMLQICGTSFFGYMINVIGITVDNINKKNVEHDNYQQTISKLKDHYQLSDQLWLEMKNDIKKKYDQSDKTIPLKKNQETQLLDFVDSTVKKNFILETNIKIIKKSIFFLTYFTVNFQNQIALKLIRLIYKKDESIQTFDITAKQRNIVIINHGKVSLFLKKRRNNSIIHKLVRTIEPIEGKPTLNVIGYSNLILNQNIDICSVANEMTSGYVLRRSDVLECIDKSLIDYQSLHEMRQKMLLIGLKESIQAPCLKDSDFHFTPNIFILTCRHSKQSKQQRIKKGRRSIKLPVQLDSVKTELDNDWYTVKKEDSQSYFDQEIHHLTKNFKKLNQFEELLQVDEGPIQNQEQPHNKETFQKQHIRLDQVKIFQHFLKHNNINYLAMQYERSCKNRTYNQRILSKLIKSQVSPKLAYQKLSKKKSTLRDMKSRKMITERKL